MNALAYRTNAVALQLLYKPAIADISSFIDITYVHNL